MRGKYELWVIICLQVVALEARQPDPDLLDVVLIMAALAAGKRALLYWRKEEQENGQDRRGLCGGQQR